MNEENIQVAVRVRPLNELERSRGDQQCINVSDDGRTVHFVTSNPSASRNAPAGAPSVRALVFDSALAGSSQARVFDAVQTIQLLKDALDGLAVTVFAYGQTGSGKTYTMTGPDSLEYSEAKPLAPDGPHGLIPRGVDALFSLIAAERDAGGLPGGCSVRASYLELYNESFNDLLNIDSTNLQLRNHPQSGAFVENLLQVECEGVNDAMMVFTEGTVRAELWSGSAVWSYGAELRRCGSFSGRISLQCPAFAESPLASRLSPLASRLSLLASRLSFAAAQPQSRLS